MFMYRLVDHADAAIIAQPGSYQIEAGLAIWECSYDAGSASDLSLLLPAFA
jgi:hypothetical protein